MLEMMDLVDENDNVIAKMSRKKIYRERLHNYRVVGVFILNNRGQLLLQRRSSSCDIFPSLTDISCGGHVASGESYEQAALRELKEELYLENAELEEFLYLKYPNQFSTNCFSKYYILRQDETPRFNKSVISSIFWADINEVVEQMKQDPSAYLSDFYKVLTKIHNELKVQNG